MVVMPNLSANDRAVLGKIRDPESDPADTAAPAVIISEDVGPDPHITDRALYDQLAQRELDILRDLSAAESRYSGDRYSTGLLEAYHLAVSRLGDLISEHGNYGSPKNDRAQIMRRIYGDDILTEGSPSPIALLQTFSPEARREAATMITEDLDACIRLLVPATAQAPISPQAARTVSAAYTQRAAIYYRTAKLFEFDRRLDLPDRLRAEIAGWTRVEFEEVASRDFKSGGRYGNRIARGLAVHANPTAKLCGEIVQTAMKKEYGEGGGAEQGC